VIHGRRLYLRELTADDAGERYERWLNDPEVTRYLESRFRRNTLDAIKDYVRTVGSDPDDLLLAIVLKQDDEHIGNIRLGPIDRHHRSAEVGIMLGEKRHWGRGYGSEAIAALTGHAFEELELHKLTANCYSANDGSARAFEKAGWQREGLRRGQLWSDGEWMDQILLGCVAGDSR
jgi:ribosomal-protein-alanine N-acetyltransferase